MLDKPSLVSSTFKPIILEETSNPKLVYNNNSPVIQSVYFTTIGDAVLYGVELWGNFELGDNGVGDIINKPQLVINYSKPKIR